MTVLSRLLFVLIPALLAASEWPQYRGPEGRGIADDAPLPLRLDPQKNLVWKTAAPNGGSSPVLTETRVFLTGYEGERLYVFALDRENGELLWKREVPRPREEPFNKTHGPASPSPVTDGENVYAFFGDFGLISLDGDGKERWRMPLGPFDNINGHGSSPIIDGQKLILAVDQNINSFIAAIDKDSGKVLWQVDRSEVTRSYGTPGVFRPSNDVPQIVMPGAYTTISYDLETGKKLWWVRRMAWQLKCVPLFDGDLIYINSWEAGGDPGQRKETAPFDQVIAERDANKDGKLSKEEVPDQRLTGDRNWLEHDLDADGFIGRRDWEFYAARRAPENSLLAIRPDGRRGDLTETAVEWRYNRSLPNTASPLLLDGLLYLIKDGGIFQSVDPETGKSLKLARLGKESVDRFWASPVAGDQKIYLLDQGCNVTVVKPGAQWETLAVSEIEGYCLATPAIADGRIFIRTDQAVYAFGE